MFFFYISLAREMRQRPHHAVAALTALVALATFAAACCVPARGRAAEIASDPRAGAPAVDFVADVQPILAKACYGCHGPEKQRSDYRLDVRSEAFDGGELFAPNIVPGDAAGSHLLEFVAEGGALEMPPEGPRLSAEEIATIRTWIEQGAKWPDEVAGKVIDKADWWAWQPLRQPTVADAIHSSEQPARIANAIDQFIVAELQRQGLAQAPRADRRTLIRRLYFDLVGLPPTPQEIAAFVADDDPLAYERLVDRLLASPRYGERWARHWMDAAHFAETHGHDQDRIREHAWRYRDYLIESFNADKPYARFIQEQVAGDALFPDDPQATVALGFLAAGPWDESSLRDILDDTVDRQIARYLDRDDMLSTVMNNVVSLTVQCARCHDHKFDAISQQEYYQLQAVFAGVERANRTVDVSAEIGERRRHLAARKLSLENDPGFVAKLLSEARSQAEVDAWEQSLARQRVRWTTLVVTNAASANGATLTKQPDGSLLSAGERPETDVYTIVARNPLQRVTALRIEVLADDRLPQRGPGRQDNGNLHLSELEVFAGVDQATPVPIAGATADFDQTDWGIARAIDGVPQTAWGIYPQVGMGHEAVFEFREAIEVSGADLKVVLKQLHGGGHLMGRVRLSVTDAALPVGIDVLPTDVIAVLETPPQERSESQRLALARHYFLERATRELATLPPPLLTYAAASQFEPDGGLKPPPGPRPIHLLQRGEIGKPLELVAPGALACVTELPAAFDVPEGSDESVRRAALAQWLTNQKNPLTWRSIVNRVWHHHFGAGIVPTPNDFGHMGETASHPELLDWLAVQFRDGNQSLKDLHRLMVTSETYCQTSRTSALDAEVASQAAAIDVDNRLLWRMNRTRLDAECVHDALLAATDRLDLRMGGPSDRQFALTPGHHVTPIIDYREFDVDSDAARRRSVYRFLFRTLPDPFQDALDCPSGDQITPARGNSVTVQQALALWNNAFVLRQAEHLAARLAGDEATTAEQIDLAVELTLGRSATVEERQSLAAYAEEHGMANMCRLLFNANEFVFID